MIALEAPEFLENLQKHLQGLLGRLDDASPRMSFPLQSLEVDRFAAGRIALIGEAAHVVPPIGAQGLNLSLRDVAELAGAVLPVLAQSGDPGSTSVLGHYDRRRRREAPGRARGVGFLNTSLASGSLPLQLARGFGLHAVNAFGPLRRTIMRGAAEGWLSLPDLMRDPPSPAPDSAAAAE